MKTKKIYTAPEAKVIRLEYLRLICLSGSVNDDVTMEDANARGFGFDDDEWDD